MTEEKIELKIRGMTCSSCALHVGKALKGVTGVINVEVPGWKSGRTIVTASPGIDSEALSRSVHEAGYEAVVTKRTGMQESVGDSEDYTGGANRPDLMVIGGGSAGFAAAIKGAELGFRVVLVEGSTMGGTCVNIGCVPSKTLIRSVGQYHTAGLAPFRGVHTSAESIDWFEVVSQKDELVSDLRKAKYEDVLEAYPEIQYIRGYAKLKKEGVEIEGSMYYPRKVVIATGARPWAPPIPGLEGAGYLTSTTAMELKNLPESMIVLGANAVGLELAQLFSRAGTDITVVEMLPRVAPGIDEEISDALYAYLEEEGLRIVTGFQTENVTKENEGYAVTGTLNGKTTTLHAEQFLVATGRRPATEGLGLEDAGVETGKHGEIIVNENLQTKNPDIYAAGDVTGRDQFVYVAAYAAGLAVENAMVGAGRVYNTSYIPRVMFTDPQVATAGLTEAQAKERGCDVKVSVLPMEHVPRALAARDTRGVVKLVADRKTDSLLGAHIVAPGAGEMIQVAVLAIRFGLKVQDLRETMFPYLTNSEAIKLAVLSFDKEVAKLSCCAG